MKGYGFHQLKYMKGEGNLLFGSLYSPLDRVASTPGFDYIEWMLYALLNSYLSVSVFVSRRECRINLPAAITM